jgi:hypothetical protein
VSIVAKTEFYWTAPAVVPLYFIITRENRLQFPYIKLFAGISAGLILMARFFLIADFLPTDWVRKAELHGWKTWAQQIQLTAGDHAVVFTNSFQKASLYTFYTGKTGISINSVNYRSNQYDLWNWPDSLSGKKVMVVLNWKIDPEDVNNNWILSEMDSIEIPFRPRERFVWLDEFYRFKDLRISLQPLSPTIMENQSLAITCRVNRLGSSVFAETFPDSLYHPMLSCQVFQSGRMIINRTVHVLFPEMLHKGVAFNLDENLPPGDYLVAVNVTYGWLPPFRNSVPKKFRVVSPEKPVN